MEFLTRGFYDKHFGQNVKTCYKVYQNFFLITCTSATQNRIKGEITYKPNHVRFI